MFFKSRKTAEAKQEQMKKELLCRENIRVNCTSDTQENVIRQVGQMLVDSGYVSDTYVDAMIKREQTCSTYMGNALALPHGVEEAKREIKASGIAVMVFPKGVKWGTETANVVIGIAGVGDEHLDILSVIAEKMMDEESARKLTDGNADADTVYEILSGKNQASYRF